MVNRLVGDIRNFPRKDTLEEDIISTVEKAFNIPVTVKRIIIFGSWGNGSAKPFRSDLDVNVILDNPEGDVLSREFQSQIEFKQHDLLSNHTLTRRYALFDGADILMNGSNTNVEEVMRIALTDGNKKAYDLTNRTDIKLDSGGNVINF